MGERFGSFAREEPGTECLRAGGPDYHLSVQHCFADGSSFRPRSLHEASHWLQAPAEPTDIIRHLEDEFSRAEAKLTNFTELKEI